MMNKKTKLIIVGGIALTISVGSFCLGSKLTKPQINPSHTANIVMQNESASKYQLDEKAVVDEIKDNLELNILNVQLRQRLTVKGNDTELSWFKNKKHIEYTGYAKYSLNLSSLNEDAVKINGNKIIVNLNRPSIDVNIDQSKIKYEDEKGWLTFYDIKLEPEVCYQLEQTAKDNMYKQLLTDDYMKDATEKANSKIKFILGTMTDKTYEVNVNWI